jgi:hypothetical protein
MIAVTGKGVYSTLGRFKKFEVNEQKRGENMNNKMIRIIVLTSLISMVSMGFAQVAPIDFEAEGNGATWTWTPFENDSNPPVGIIANPDPTGINTSATVASFTALTTGQPWAGFESLHGSDIGPFSFDVTNSTVKLMVWKSVISDVGVKFAEANGEAQPEVKVANTVINQWEELTFDLSGSIGAGITGIVDQIIIFPDFDLGGRTTDNTVYIDNVTFSGQELPPGPAAHAPVPAAPEDDVISIFSDSYTNVAGTNFYPGWGQETVVSEVPIEGNNTLLYAGLNYQGVELGSVLDLSEMESIHVDFWSTNSTELQIFLISQTTGEQPYTLAMENDTWVSTDVPLSHFSDLGLGLNDIFQLKFVGNGDVYLDNIYFEGEGGALDPTPYSPIDFEAGGFGADWTWTVFENGPNDPLVIGENPSTTGINPSATVASITARTDGAPWVGFESLHGAGIGSFSLDETNSTVKIMVYKSVISDVGIKFAEANGEAQPEIKVANTLVDEWEELTFDFSGQIGLGATGILDQIIIFPDFDLAGRTTDNLCYVDNITFHAQVMPEGPAAHAPVPEHSAESVFSIFSDAYDDLAGTEFNPNWGQSTVVTMEDIEGNPTMKYGSLNYQGTNLGGPEGVDQHVEGYGYLHLDYYSTNATALNFFLISRTTGEQAYALPVMNGEWVSVDIPTAHFAGLGLSLADIFQFKVDGGDGSTTTVWFDNWYFHNGAEVIEDPVVAAPTPTIPSEDVFSIFSDAYDDLAETNFNPNWGQSTVVTMEDIEGNPTMKYGSLNYQGTNLGGAEGVDQHVEGYGYLHLDYYSTNATALNFFLISRTTGEQAYALPIINGEWVSVDIPTAYFADLGLSLADIFQFKIDGGDGSTEVWFDNWFFFNAEAPYTEPNIAAPTPMHEATDVMSIYSDAYMNLSETNFNPDWGQSTVVMVDEQIEGNNTLKYSSLNYQGTNLGGAEGVDQDLSEYDYLHVDMWLAGPADLNFFLISRTSGEQAYQLPNHYGEWLGLDIPLDNFTGLGLDITDIFQFKVDGGDGETTTIWFDNWYFYATEPVDPPSLAASYVMAPMAGALMVGPEPYDGSWWSSSADDVTTRACFFDDEYVFMPDGSFMNIMDGATWLETWQGVDADGCGAPVAPHDGMTPATWTMDEEAGTLTLNGVGAFLGIPKVFTGGELTDPADAPESITYQYSLSEDGETLTLLVSIGTGYWTFTLVDASTVQPPALLAETYVMAPMAGALMVGPEPYDGSWWSSSADDVTTRACFFDDEYVFMPDGSFMNIMDGATWLETWQGVDADGCGAPVAPHDGMTPATWAMDEEAGTLTLSGVGAFLGIPKVFTGGELTDPADAPETITYNYTLSDNNQTLTLVVSIGTGYWTFTLVDINSVVEPEPTPMVAAPTPAVSSDMVFSIYSDTYDDLAETNFNPDWGQSTEVSEVEIEGNMALRYTSLNYQGTNLGNAEGLDQDVSGYDYLHLDMWLPYEAGLNFFLISRTTGEQAYALPMATEEWVSVDIPLSHFTDLGMTMTDIFQFKVDGGNGGTTVYFDNWYFHSGTVSVDDIALLPEVSVLQQNYPNPFNPTTTIKYGMAEASPVSVIIYDIRGNVIRTMQSETQPAGWYQLTWNGLNDTGMPVSTGLYLTRLQAGSTTQTIKMLYLK